MAQITGSVPSSKCGILEQPNTFSRCAKCLGSVDQTCHSCSRVEANPDQWVAVVQLRQHISHKVTLTHLVQLIVQHKAAAQCQRITHMEQGFDFYFAKRSHAMELVEFVDKFAPVRSRDDKQLVSHDSESNSYNYKYTFSIDIPPICCDDLIFLHPSVVGFGLRNLGAFVLCTKVTDKIALVDTSTLQHCLVDANQYWRTPFESLLSSRVLVEYIVLDVEIVSSEVESSDEIVSSEYVLADAQVARVSDFGVNDTSFNVRTHLGNLLHPGDYALGYDLCGANSEDMKLKLDNCKGLVIPEVILVQKSNREKC